MYEIITLPNGVRIAHEKMSGVRSAAVGIWVGVGSRYEKRGEEGSAHFIEHMLFKGTAHSTAAELAGRMDAIGGQVNAFTSRDSTCFYARVLDSHLDEASDILCEMFFDSLFSESDVVNERGVVLEEIDMYRDTPEDIVVEPAHGQDLPGALGKPVLGRPASLNGMTGASLRAFKEREYSPERIVVSVCGSFTEDNLARLCSRFSALAPSRPAACRQERLHARRGRKAQGNGAEPLLSLLPRTAGRRRGPLLVAGALHGARRRHVLPPLPDRPRKARPLLQYRQLHGRL